jgi:hypothetical protein
MVSKAEPRSRTGAGSESNKPRCFCCFLQRIYSRGEDAPRAAGTNVTNSTSGRAPKWLIISAAHKLPISPQMGSGKSRVKP